MPLAATAHTSKRTAPGSAGAVQSNENWAWSPLIARGEVWESPAGTSARPWPARVVRSPELACRNSPASAAVLEPTVTVTVTVSPGEIVGSSAETSMVTSPEP